MKVMAGGQKPLGITPSTDKTKAVLQREGASLAALKWVLRNPQIDTTIPSMIDMDQLDDNMRAMAAPWSPADEKVLAARLREIGPLYCRYCGGCEGQCPQGLPVSDVLRCLTYADGYGEFALGREQFHTLPRPISSRFAAAIAASAP